MAGKANLPELTRVLPQKQGGVDMPDCSKVKEMQLNTQTNQPSFQALLTQDKA